MVVTNEAERLLRETAFKRGEGFSTSISFDNSPVVPNFGKYIETNIQHPQCRSSVTIEVEIMEEW